MNLQPVFDIAEVCARKGIRRAIISPGSRNAPLTIAFNRHPEIECFSVSDERSAAFIGLGLALKSDEPTALICTSGSAVLNYAPAVVESFFNHVPLLLITADRPPEWIGHRDGQTIFQDNVFGKHVKASFDFPSLDEKPDDQTIGHQMINQAINVVNKEPKGPVHVNVPLREPFYPEKDEKVKYSDCTKSLENHIEEATSDSFDLKQFQRIIIVVGQQKQDTSITTMLNRLSTVSKIPVVCDIISNQHQVEGAIQHQDLFLKNHAGDDLKPDLVITIGMSVISKNLKLFLRGCDKVKHWHIGPEDKAPDTFKKLTKQIQAGPVAVLSKLEAQNSDEFYQAWQVADKQAAEAAQTEQVQTFNELEIYRQILSDLPEKIDLHLANSLSVRYANFIGLKNKPKVEVFCNRGTSGIDGSNSTAVGTAMVSGKQTLLLTGDVAFFYDRNAFWHNHNIENLKIIVFNNHGGNIFRMIDGPSNQPELEEFFETHQQLSAKHLAAEFDFQYYAARDYQEFQESLTSFFNLTGKKAILEVFTDPQINKTAFKKLFQKMAIFNA